MLKSNTLRLFIILSASVLTPILMNVLPVAGGGVSLIFVLTVPITLGISLLMLIYFLLRKSYNWNQDAFDITLIIFTIFSLCISLIMFPYK